MARFFYAGIASAMISVASASDGPNIVWIIADDMGIDMGCYGDEYATIVYTLDDGDAPRWRVYDGVR